VDEGGIKIHCKLREENKDWGCVTCFWIDNGP